MVKAVEKPKDDSLTPERTEFLKKSLEFFKNPGLLELIRQELDKDHINDDREKMFVFCSELSSQLPPQYRFSTALTGYTSEGKTNLWKTTSKHLPGSWYLDLTRATKSTIEDDIKGVNLIYFGEEGANKDIVETLKQLVEDGITAMKKDVRDNFKSVRIEEQPRKVGIYSTTADASDQELATRYAVACITGSPMKYKKVNDDTLRVSSDVSLEIQRAIRNTSRTWISVGLEQLQPVDIITVPYAHLFTVDNRQARSMRDLKRFLNLIRVLAWLCQHRRIMYKEQDRTVIVANPVDYWNAMEIGSDIFAQSLSGIEQRLQNVIDSYQRIVREHPENIHTFERDGKPDPRFDNTLVWIDRSLLQDDLGINSRETIRNHLKSLESKGLFASIWTGNRNFVSLKHPSANDSPTKYPLITGKRNEVYHSIKKLYNKTLVGHPSVDRSLVSPDDQSLLKLLSEETSERTIRRKSRHAVNKTSKKHEIVRSKSFAHMKPADVREFCEANYDDEKTVSYEQLRQQFPDRLLTGLIESQLLKIQPNGNYRFFEVIASDE